MDWGASSPRTSPVVSTAVASSTKSCTAAIGQFADFLGISQSNATYKVNNLIRKGYIVKENSDTDRREYHLKLSDKFYCYNGLMQSYIDTVMARIHERFTPEELATFEHVLAVMSDELMPECDVPKK